MNNYIGKINQQVLVIVKIVDLKHKYQKISGDMPNAPQKTDPQSTLLTYDHHLKVDPNRIG